MTVQCTEASTEVLELEDNGHMTFSTFIINIKYLHSGIKQSYILRLLFFAWQPPMNI
jgi:hypothetical protein